MAALLVAALNFHLSFVRPWWHRRRHGGVETLRHVSGIPVVGTVLVLLAGVLGQGALGTTVIALLALVLDTGGAPWFLVATWRDTSFWDASG